jgi:hypothetical protein
LSTFSPTSLFCLSRESYELESLPPSFFFPLQPLRRNCGIVGTSFSSSLWNTDYSVAGRPCPPLHPFSISFSLDLARLLWHHPSTRGLQPRGLAFRHSLGLLLPPTLLCWFGRPWRLPRTRTSSPNYKAISRCTGQIALSALPCVHPSFNPPPSHCIARLPY